MNWDNAFMKSLSHTVIDNLIYECQISWLFPENLWSENSSTLNLSRELLGNWGTYKIKPYQNTELGHNKIVFILTVESLTKRNWGLCLLISNNLRHIEELMASFISLQTNIDIPDYADHVYVHTPD